MADKETFIQDIEIEEIRLPVTFHLNTGETIRKEVRSIDLSDSTLDSIFNDLSKCEVKTFHRLWHRDGRKYSTGGKVVEMKTHWRRK